MVTDYNSDNPDNNAPYAMDRLRESSLKSAGYVYLLADAALFASGMLAGRPKEASSGLLYAAAGGVLARYGNQNAEQHFDNLSQHIAAYLQKEGLTLPEHGSISRDSLIRHDGVIHKIEDYLYQHPTQVANAIFAVGGVQMARSGLSHRKTWDALAGGAVTAGALAGIMLPETTEKKPRSGNVITDTIQTIKEKPLMLTGGLYMLNNVALAASGLKERRMNPTGKSHVFKLLTAAGYMVANSLMAISSKDSVPPATDKNMKIIYRGAAQIIASQPPQVQEVTLKHVANFIAAQPETTMGAAKIEAMLHQAVNSLAKEAQQGDETSTWQDRVASSPSDTPSLQK